MFLHKQRVDNFKKVDEVWDIVKCLIWFKNNLS